LTLPVDVWVEVVAYKADEVSPKRTSLPSMLPTLPAMPDVCDTPAAATAGFAWCSETEAMPSQPPNSTAITARIATPWRTLPTIFPNV
jgi:hypothetical protein